MDKRLRPLIALLAIIILIININLFLPDVAAATWHLTHKNPVRFNGWDVTVPSGWMAVSEGGYLTLLRFRRFYEKEGEAQIGIHHITLPVGTDFESEDWQARFLASMSEKGYSYVSQHTSEVDEVKAYCFDFKVKNEPSAVQWYCTFPSELLDFEYHGDQLHSSDGDSALSGMKKAH